MTLEDFLVERQRITDVFDTLLTDTLSEGIAQIDSELDGDELPEEAIIAGLIGGIFDRIRTEYFAVYDDVTGAILDYLTDNDLLQSPGSSSDEIALLDELKQFHEDQIDTSERAWIDRYTNELERPDVPGVDAQPYVNYMQDSSKDIQDDIISNTDVFHRIATDVLIGALIVSGGKFVASALAGKKKYVYAGPKDKRNRPHCASYVGGVATRQEIDSISPAQIYLAGDDPATLKSPMGAPCRHHWTPTKS